MTTEQVFSPTSPWNTTAIGSVDANNATMVTNASAIGSLQYSFNQTGAFAIQGINDWAEGEYYGVPVFEANASTPRVNVSDSTGWWGGFTNVPMPTNAAPALGSDHHLVIWDKSTNLIYEYWTAVKSGSNWSAGAGARWSATGAGWGSAIQAGLAARAYGGSLIAGLIRRSEMLAGVIPHALAFAYPYSRGLFYANGLGVDGVNMNIANHCDNNSSSNRNSTGNIPEGAHFRLKASVNLTSLSTPARIIGQALKTYGAYVVDVGGALTFYAEILSPHGQSWSGLLSTLSVNMFTATDFELLSLPATLTPAG